MRYEVISSAVELQNGTLARKGDVIEDYELAPAIGEPPVDEATHDGTLNPWAPAEAASLLSSGHIKERA